MKKRLAFVLLLSLTTSLYAIGQINIATVPYTISTPGSYIVVKDLHTPQDQNCIVINTADVSIDLNGHTLYGAGTTVGSTGDGIFLNGIYPNIAIFNGTIRDFKGNGIDISTSLSLNQQVYNIRAYGNGTYGILMYSGTIRDCVASGNAKSGIIINTGLVKDNNASYNGESGLSASIGCNITNNTFSSNSAYGIFALDACNIIGNNTLNNAYDGINTNPECIIIGNNINGNGQSGINPYLYCTIKDNNVNGNSGDGIVVFQDSQVVGNTISQHTNGTNGHGINVQGTGIRIDSNHIVGNRIGIGFGTNSTTWYGRNTFHNNSGGNTSGSAPADPGTPYNNQNF